MFIFKNQEILNCCFCEFKIASEFLIASITVITNKSKKVKFT